MAMQQSADWVLTQVATIGSTKPTIKVLTMIRSNKIVIKIAEESKG